MTPAVPRPDTTILETERLFLRELLPSDVDALAEVLGDAETMRFYPHPKSRQETAAWIEWNLRSYREHEFGLWGLVLKEKGKLVGDCGLTIQDVDGMSSSRSATTSTGAAGISDWPPKPPPRAATMPSTSSALID